MSGGGGKKPVEIWTDDYESKGNVFRIALRCGEGFFFEWLKEAIVFLAVVAEFNRRWRCVCWEHMGENSDGVRGGGFKIRHS